MDCLSLPTPPDHPRIRGEHHGYFAFRVMMVGSSPHTRGAPAFSHGRGFPDWIIPAYAGSTSEAGEPLGGDEDHPRIRGEHVHVGPPPFPGVGSSPHTRGARGLCAPSDRGAGIIPAYAGSTRGTPSFARPERDHPRIRGEHTPTPRRAARRWDHPRIRGEHAERHNPRGNFTGSSPHTRGAPLRRRPARHRRRIIPAYAGSTPGRRGRRPSGWDHPRIRGEH